MYDLQRTATIEIGGDYLSQMITRQAQEMGILDIREFIVVTEVSADDLAEHVTITTECDVYKYWDN